MAEKKNEKLLKEGIEINVDGSAIIKLEFPISGSNGTKIESMTMRRPKVKDQTRAVLEGGSELEQETKLFADLTMNTAEDIGNMDMKDHAKLRKAYESFLS